MPWCITGHLRCVVRNDDTVEIDFLKESHHPEHIDVTVIDEYLIIFGNLSLDVSEMDIADAMLHAVLLDGVINVSVCHFLQASEAEFQLIAGAGGKVNDVLIELRLIDKTRLSAQTLHRGIYPDEEPEQRRPFQQPAAVPAKISLIDPKAVRNG